MMEGVDLRESKKQSPRRPHVSSIPENLSPLMGDVVGAPRSRYLSDVKRHVEDVMPCGLSVGEYGR
jgi:hypothetical protein